MPFLLTDDDLYQNGFAHGQTGTDLDNCIWATDALTGDDLKIWHAGHSDGLKAYASDLRYTNSATQRRDHCDYYDYDDAYDDF